MRAPIRRDIKEKQKDRKESSDTEGQKAKYTQYHPLQTKTSHTKVKNSKKKYKTTKHSPLIHSYHKTRTDRNPES